MHTYAVSLCIYILFVRLWSLSHIILTCARNELTLLNINFFLINYIKLTEWESLQTYFTAYSIWSSSFQAKSRQEHTFFVPLISFSEFAFEKVLSFDSIYLDPSIQCTKIRERMVSNQSQVTWHQYILMLLSNSPTTIPYRDIELWRTWFKNILTRFVQWFILKCGRWIEDENLCCLFNGFYISTNNISTINRINRS